MFVDTTSNIQINKPINNYTDVNQIIISRDTWSCFNLRFRYFWFLTKYNFVFFINCHPIKSGLWIWDIHLILAVFVFNSVYIWTLSSSIGPLDDKLYGIVCRWPRFSWNCLSGKNLDLSYELSMIKIHKSNDVAKLIVNLMYNIYLFFHTFTSAGEVLEKLLQLRKCCRTRDTRTVNCKQYAFLIIPTLFHSNTASFRPQIKTNFISIWFSNTCQKQHIA